MADPEIRKRRDDDDDEAPARLTPLGAEAAPDDDRLRSIGMSESDTGRLRPIVSTAVQQPENGSVLNSPRSSLMSFRSREEARRHGEDLSAPAGGPQVIPEPGSSDAERVKLAQIA